MQSQVNTRNSPFENISFNNMVFCRLKKKSKGLNYGEIIFDNKNTIIPHYSSIYRSYFLEKSLLEFDYNEFLIEEKLDGYNVRIANINNEIIAFTRGGFPCPYSTEVINEKYPQIKQFLYDYPKLVLACEFIGENPYNNTSITLYGNRPRLFVFDLMKLKKKEEERVSSKNLLKPTEERKELLSEFDIPQIESFGVFSAKDIQEIKDLIKNLDRQHREGIVIKPLVPPLNYIKYVTPHSHIGAIKDHITKCFEGDTAHFRKRLFLLSAYLEEFGEESDYENIYNNLGHEMLSSIQECFKSNKKSELFTITISKSNWNQLEKLLNRSTVITILNQKIISNGKLRISFEKNFKKTTSFIQSIKNGRLFLD